tara:strand:+ start:35436 stop:35684 length:249 start_codon:yes stop_codon:yes gene_type:complete
MKNLHKKPLALLLSISDQPAEYTIAGNGRARSADELGLERRGYVTIPDRDFGGSSVAGDPKSAFVTEKGQKLVDRFYKRIGL